MIDDGPEVFRLPFPRRDKGDDGTDPAHDAGLRGDGVNAAFSFVRGAQTGAELGIECLWIAVAAVVEHETRVRALLDELHTVLQLGGGMRAG